MQVLGNICLSLASILYLLPLQQLLLEVARKRDDGSAALAGLLVIAPLWLLLLVGMVVATAHGGLDILPLKRPLLHTLVIFGTLALAVLTFVSFTAHFRAPWSERLTFGLPIYVVPLLTLAFAAVVINPGLAARVPVGALRLPWLIVAGLSLAGCLGYVGFDAVRRVTRTTTQIVHRAAQNPGLETKMRAEVPALDPERDFRELLNHAAYADSAQIRDAAMQRLRSNPRLIAQLTEALAQDDPSAAITFIAQTGLTDEERGQLAAPLLTSMQGFGEYIQGRLSYFPKDWLKRVRAWGRSTYPAIAAQFAGANPDFARLPDAFDRAFVPGAN